MSGARVQLVPGVIWQPLDDTLCAAYSPLSGETHLLNNTAIGVLELLAEPGWHHPADVVHQLAREAERPEAEVAAVLGEVWTTLVDGGLVRRERSAAAA